jgi:hypothetical protein
MTGTKGRNTRWSMTNIDHSLILVRFQFLAKLTILEKLKLLSVGMRILARSGVRSDEVLGGGEDILGHSKEEVGSKEMVIWRGVIQQFRSV